MGGWRWEENSTAGVVVVVAAAVVVAVAPWGGAEIQCFWVNHFLHEMGLERSTRRETVYYRLLYISGGMFFCALNYLKGSANTADPIRKIKEIMEHKP